jgi:hypothetical protein
MLFYPKRGSGLRLGDRGARLLRGEGEVGRREEEREEEMKRDEER